MHLYLLFYNALQHKIVWFFSTSRVSFTCFSKYIIYLQIKILFNIDLTLSAFLIDFVLRITKVGVCLAQRGRNHKRVTEHVNESKLFRETHRATGFPSPGKNHKPLTEPTEWVEISGRVCLIYCKCRYGVVYKLGTFIVRQMKSNR